MDIWAEEIGTEISEKDAMEKATALLIFSDAIYWPIKKEDFHTPTVRKLKGKVVGKVVRKLSRN